MNIHLAKRIPRGVHCFAGFGCGPMVGRASYCRADTRDDAIFLLEFFYIDSRVLVSPCLLRSMECLIELCLGSTGKALQ